MDFTSSFVLVALSMAAGTSSTLSAVNWSSIKDTKGDITKVTPNWKGNKSELRIYYPSYFLTNPNNTIDTLWMPLTFVCDVNLTEPPSKTCVCVCARACVNFLDRNVKCEDLCIVLSVSIKTTFS